MASRGTTTEAARRALLDAGEAVITEKGFRLASADEVAERAKVKPQIFRAHFEDMGELLRALSTSFRESMMTVTTQSTGAGIWKGAPARDVVEVAIRSIVDVVFERRGLVRAFLAEAPNDPSLAEDLREIGTHMSKRVLDVLKECTNVPAAPTRTIAFSLLVPVALAHHYILVGDQWSGVSFTKEQLTEETARAVCAYLGLQPTIAIREESPDMAATAAVRTIR